eukprot:761825-Hanusia_phi.AAC.2
MARTDGQWRMRKRPPYANQHQLEVELRRVLELSEEHALLCEQLHQSREEERYHTRAKQVSGGGRIGRVSDKLGQVWTHIRLAELQEDMEVELGLIRDYVSSTDSLRLCETGGVSGPPALDNSRRVRRWQQLDEKVEGAEQLPSSHKPLLQLQQLVHSSLRSSACHVHEGLEVTGGAQPGADQLEGCRAAETPRGR